MAEKSIGRNEDFDKTAVVATLNEILEAELAGVVRYAHYSLMVLVTIVFPSFPGCGPRRPRAWIMRIRPAS